MSDDKMKKLKEERDKRGKLEMARAAFWARKDAEKEKRNDILAVVDSMLDLKYQSDYQLLFSLFLDWLKKSKTQNQKETLNASFNALMRIQSYVSTLQTVSKTSTGEMLDLRLQDRLKQEKIWKLEKMIKTLKAEIEYNEEN